MIPYLRLQSEWFNKSKILENFINDCCFGEDVADFLIEKFSIIGYSVQAKYQEDWGWQIELIKNKVVYMFSIGLPCEVDQSGNVKYEEEEFIIHIEKKRNLLQTILCKSKRADEHFYQVFDQLLKNEKRIRSFQWVNE